MNHTASTNTDDTRTGDSEVRYRLAMRIAWVAAVFSLVVAAVLLYDFSRRTVKDPLEAPALQALKAALKLQPTNEELREQIRSLDLQSREEYFRQRTLAAGGAMLLCGGILVFIVAMKWAGSLHRTLPTPQPRGTVPDWQSQWTATARWGVASLLVLIGVVAVGLSVGLRSPLPVYTDEAAVVSQSAANTSSGPASVAKSKLAVYAPSEEDIRNAWPRFRGPMGSGVSSFMNVPDTWDGSAAKNIVWKTPIPLPGNNSPIVCGRRAFLSGADAKRRQVYCFDTTDGKLLWQQDVPSTPQSVKPVKLNDDTGFASCTLATDGRYVAAIFANGDLAAYDFEGKLAWSKSLGIPENPYGHAASLAVWKSTLLVPMDQATVKAGKSKLTALDIATGKTLWEVKRPVLSSWTTPIVIHAADRDQVITVGNPWVIAYDVKDGAELWRAKYFRGDVAPSPVFAGAVVYAVGNDTEPMLAIRPDGKGDVTETHVLWKAEDNLPDTCSPLATEELVVVTTSEGMVTAYDAKKGEKLWEQEFEGVKFASSPSLVGNRLYLVSRDGKGWIFEPSRKECKKVGEASLGEACVTSPAFQDGRIYLRGEKHLFCIGKPKAEQAKP